MKRVFSTSAFLTLPLTASLAAALLFPGCASTSSGEAPSAAAQEEKEESPGEKERELDSLERKLGVAQARMGKMRLEQEFAEAQHEAKIRQARAELELAEVALARFREADAVNQLASQRLDLRTAKDRAQEAADELAQIELMYKEQDLDDLTAEFVVSRGRRSAERAAQRIAIQEGMLRALEEREHPQRIRELELALDRARTGLENVEREGELARQGKAIAFQEAENDLAELVHEIEALREGDQP